MPTPKIEALKENEQLRLVIDVVEKGWTVYAEIWERTGKHGLLFSRTTGRLETENAVEALCHAMHLVSVGLGGLDADSQGPGRPVSGQLAGDPDEDPAPRGSSM